MERVSLAKFLLRRLKEAGCDDIFGVPGDFVLGFFNELLKSEINYIGTCNELNAAYAADAYARLKGIGALATTYSVGELSAINGVAGSYAESVPVVKIGGVPATSFFRDRPLLHHTLGDYLIPAKMYAHITGAQTILDNVDTAVAEVDRVLRVCLKKKIPVYIGVPADMVFCKVNAPAAPFKKPKLPKSDPAALNEAVLEALHLLHQSRRPIFIPGIEIARHDLRQDFEKLLETSGIPYATMMLSKSLIDEDHKQFIGLYSGDRSDKCVKERVETSDCLIIFGEKLTDFNTGGFSARMDRRSTVEVFYDCVRIMFHVYNKVFIHDFIRLLALRVAYRVPKSLEMDQTTEKCVHGSAVEFVPQPVQPVTMSRFFDRMSRFLKPNSVVIAETGVSLFSAAEVLMPQNTRFIGQTFYGSIGYTVGACLGACIAAKDRQVYLFVGDGSFQVTCQDLSTMIRYGCKPIIFLINNDGYTIERVIVDRPYNDIQPWKYHKLPEVFGGKCGVDCHTEGELEEALAASEKSKSLMLIEVHLDRFDCNAALKKAGHSMAMNNRLLGTGESDDEEEDIKRDKQNVKDWESDSELEDLTSFDVIKKANPTRARVILNL